MLAPPTHEQAASLVEECRVISSRRNLGDIRIMEPFEVYLLWLVVDWSPRAIYSALATPVKAPSVDFTLVCHADCVIRAARNAT